MIVIFLLGIGNFALYGAVIGSGHPALHEVPWLRSLRGRRIAFFTEFTMLLVSLYLVTHGWPRVVWAYMVYSMANGLSAWLLLTRRL